MSRLIAVLSVSTLLMVFGIGGLMYFRTTSDDPFADCRKSRVAGGAAEIGGPFELTGMNGERMSDSDVITGPTLLYFGYTFCPDICPNDISRNAIAADIAEEQGLDLGLAFISVDPNRDGPEELADFTSSIHPDIMGLTGTPEEIADAASAYRVYFAKSGDDPEYYLMDHSTFTYLVAPEVGFLDFFGSGDSPEDIAARSACYAKRL